MKTGIVMDLRDNTAVILQPNGNFTKRKALPEWRVGDVVSLSSAASSQKRILQFAAAAACFVLLLVGGFTGYSAYFATSALISVDINPSFELKINTQGKVIAATAYNDDGTNLLNEFDLKGKPYSVAFASIMQSDAMQPYLQQNEFLDVSVYADKNEEAILEEITQLTNTVATSHPQIQVTCGGANQEIVEKAHQHGLTPGKYKAFLELQELDPTAEISDYSDSGVGKIRKRIRECRGEDEETDDENNTGHGSTAVGTPENEHGGGSGNGGGNGDGKGSGNANHNSNEDENDGHGKQNRHGKQ